MRITRIETGLFLERLIASALVLVAVASVCMAFWPPPSPSGQQAISFSQLRKFANRLQMESNPILRESEPTAGRCRQLGTRIPLGSRIFLPDFLGPENYRRLGYYYYAAYYLFPREVAISLGQPPRFQMDQVVGRRPSSPAEVQQAGYDFEVDFEPGGKAHLLALGSSPFAPPDTKAEPIPVHDWWIALLLPLIVSVTGSRIVRGLFGDLEGVFSAGEWLASGLAVGAFLLTQLILGLRLVGARWERPILTFLALWTVAEGVLWISRRRACRPRLEVTHLWWLVLLPAALILWCQFRLSGLLGLEEYDAVAIWALKAKILHCFAGRELWVWFRNSNLAYAHMDYPLLVPALHALTWGALGHVNDFVTNFWNQWMLLLLAWAVLGACRFPERRPWLIGAAVVALVLLPMTRAYAIMQGATVPMLFYIVLGSVQLAIGMADKHAERLQLGLFLLLAAVMVKFEGGLLLFFWILLLALDRDCRAAYWPLRQMGLAGMLGLLAWLPYIVFRLHGPVPHPQSAWLNLFLQNAGSLFHVVAMTWLVMLSGRFFNNGFAVWSSPDNQHAVWHGHWMGWGSLVDEWTQGAAWVCLLLFALAWCRGNSMRKPQFRLFLVFFAFVAMLSIVWSTVQPGATRYASALGGFGYDMGGRYVYPVLLGWFVAGCVLFARDSRNDADDLTRNDKPKELDGILPD